MKRSFFVCSLLVILLAVSIPTWDRTIIARTRVKLLQKSQLLRKWHFPEAHPKVHLLAVDPLLIHIEDFITVQERAYLLHIA